MTSEIEMDFEQARFNMIEQQIRPWEVLDQHVLDLIQRTPREDYVPPEYRNLAFADTRIPIGEGAVMMPPREEARMLQMLEVEPNDHVLEIGTGSGYVTALLAAAAKRVTSVEISEVLHHQATEKLRAHGIGNVELQCTDGLRGWPKDAPYDAISVTGSVPELPDYFQHQLRPGGRLFIVVGRTPAMEALLISRVGADEWARESHFETVLPPLIGAQSPPSFEL